jgi:hypothetical protein
MERAVDPDARHPFYDFDWVMTLRDLEEGVAFLTIDTRAHEVSLTTARTSWATTTEQQCVVWGPGIHVIAEGTESPNGYIPRGPVRHIIYLEDKGLQPDEDGHWNKHVFSVLITKSNMRHLDAWLKARGGQGLEHYLRWAHPTVASRNSNHLTYIPPGHMLLVARLLSRL